MSAVTGRGQFRISSVQVFNWGAYQGHKIMQVHRQGTAILGPSGRGKSTILDAMASVIMSNPQTFNQAARDERAGKSERTVYSYARGQTDRRKDANRRSNVTSFLRPPGAPGFPSGSAITWQHDDDRKITVFRLAWIGPDTTTQDAVNDATVYGIVFDDFDLASLRGLSGNRAGSSPLSRGNLLGLLNPEGGDQVDSSQAKIHAIMRSAMSMGRTEEAQKNAQTLLRRAQAAKGLFNINDVFKQFVLGKPLAMDRWFSALDAYREATRLYDLFEHARQRADALKDLPDYAEQYFDAQEQYSAKRRLLRGDGEGSEPLRIWHGQRVRAWSDRCVDDLLPLRAKSKAAAKAAEQEEVAANAAVSSVLAEITAAGGDRTGVLRARLEGEQNDLQRVDDQRRRADKRLRELGFNLPEEASEFDALVSDLGRALKEKESELAQATAVAKSATIDAGELARTLRNVESERKNLADASNIPPFARHIRERIISGTGVPEDRLPFIGELIEVRPANRQWERAVLSVIGGVARELVVDRRDFALVRQFVNKTPMGGDVRLVPVDVSAGPPVQPIPGTIPEILELAESPYSPWLSRELRDRFSYVYVESDSDLDSIRPRGTQGAVTRSGMRTASRERFVKVEPNDRYRWLGWETARLRADLDDEIETLKRQHGPADERASAAETNRNEIAGLINRLTLTVQDLDWRELDRGAVVGRISALAAQIDAAESPETTDRRKRLEKAQSDLKNAVTKVTKIADKHDVIEDAYRELVDLQDELASVIENGQPLSAQDTEALGALGFVEPAYTAEQHRPHSLKAAVNESYKRAAADLNNQIDRHREKADGLEKAIIATMRGYRSLDDQTAREIDESMESLTALLEIREQLVRDDLPRAKENWLQQARQDMNTKLRTLLVQIEEDRRIILRGLAPINEVLSHVVFREVAKLKIEPVEKPSKELNELREMIEEHTSNSLGLMATEDTAELERGFVRLRKSLGKLDEMSQTSESWRQRVFDAREHIDFRAIEIRPDGEEIIHDGVSGMSGGEGQELIAFILGAALRYRLGDGGASAPVYASIVLDEGFVKADSDYTGRALAALSALGFQLIVGAPREKATAFEGHVANVAYITSDVANGTGVHIYNMTIQEALALDEPADSVELEEDAA